MKYCESTSSMKRWLTREVMVGKVGVGRSNPVRIQSMTTSDTRDVVATVEQIKRLSDVGCEIVRVTVQGIKEAEACEGIKESLLSQGYDIPIVADIHFFPPAAMRVVDFVDKVRVNPGNFADKRASFKVIEYDDAAYGEELVRIEEKFSPLVLKCRQLKRAMRIGTNHGSLSDRIMNRYGDTPMGMVESALEFGRICRKYDFHDLIFSMKASNPQVMIQAYRLLVREMMKLGWNYPLHLGVTEAGEGEDGRVKSAMGMGALLLDGLGDTVRVSLTEDPWHEIDPCKRLRKLGESYVGRGVEPFEEKHRLIDQLNRRKVNLPGHISLHRDGSVFIPYPEGEDIFRKVGCDVREGEPKLKHETADQVVIKGVPKDLSVLKALQAIGVGVASEEGSFGTLKIVSLSQVQNRKVEGRFKLAVANASEPLALRISDEEPAAWEALKELSPALIFLAPRKSSPIHYGRRFFEWMQENKLSIPVILNFSYDCDQDDLVIRAAAECGALLCDGLGEGLYLEGPYDSDFLRNLSFGILQAARMRTSKTEFISCPSCGRTLFNLQEVSRRIRDKTNHLPGVKIAIMGCIVNGPGEMADAHFGYVGSKPGKIDLYVGKERVKKDIEASEADQELIDLIKSHGMWKDLE